MEIQSTYIILGVIFTGNTTWLHNARASGLCTFLVNNALFLKRRLYGRVIDVTQISPNVSHNVWENHIGTRRNTQIVVFIYLEIILTAQTGKLAYIVSGG